MWGGYFAVLEVEKLGRVSSSMRAILLLLLSLVACTARAAGPHQQFLYLWTASADSTAPDFLAVLDVTEDSGRYGRLVTTVPVPGRGGRPHHTEYAIADGWLFANGFASGRSFVFDLSVPAAPRLAAEFGDLEGLTHPHSYIPLPSGNRLVTFQMRHGGGRVRAGGLVEVTSAGVPVRARSADYPGADSGLRVYSAAVVPSLDRIVTTSTDMVLDFPASRLVQVWRLSDLTLLHTIPLPDGPAGDEGLLSAEPRVLDDGKTVIVSTFHCGLFLLGGLDGDAPSARLVASLPRPREGSCAVPAVAGRYWLMTAPGGAVTSFDLSDPTAPREVGRITLEDGNEPHWLAVSPDGRRVVVTGYQGMASRVVIARLDPNTGALALDQRFREEGASEAGFRMQGKTWPHGGNAPGIPHGAVFSRP